MKLAAHVNHAAEMAAAGAAKATSCAAPKCFGDAAHDTSETQFYAAPQSALMTRSGFAQQPCARSQAEPTCAHACSYGNDAPAYYEHSFAPQPVSANPYMKLSYHLIAYYEQQVSQRRAEIARRVRDTVPILQEILKEVEALEPRFVSSLVEQNGRYEGLFVNSELEFEVVLYLNQMGVFNFVDDGQVPGCAVLKLSDGRKRSMSLWVEFITASGYLSARKIRSRFHALLSQAVEQSAYKEVARVLPDTGDVRLRMADGLQVLVTPAFRCGGLWPRSAHHWPTPNAAWPSAPVAADLKAHGFDLLSRDSAYIQEKHNAEGDSWLMSFASGQRHLLSEGSRKKCLKIVAALGTRWLGEANGVLSGEQLAALVLYECEKHPRSWEWADGALGERVNGVLLQAISSLQNRKCPAYLLPQVDLLRGKSPVAMDAAARKLWCLLRQLLLRPAALTPT